MKFDPDDSWLHKTDINPHYEELLKEGDRKMMNKLEEIQTLQARCEFLKKNLRGAVQMYKDEKERRKFAENELALIKGVGNNSPEMKELQEENKKLKEDLIKVKESLKDPVNEARKAGL